MDEMSDDTVQRLHNSLGGVIAPEVMHGDSLAIVICTAYDNPDEEPDEDGWTESAKWGCYATLQAIRDHYAPLAARIEADARRIAELRKRAELALAVITHLREERDTLAARLAEVEHEREADARRIAELQGLVKEAGREVNRAANDLTMLAGCVMGAGARVYPMQRAEELRALLARMGGGDTPKGETR